ncbi:hypothetical protein Tco_1020736 [Tanacetum coccineum]
MTRLKTFRLKSMWGNYNFDFACSMASGRSGGLISTWDLNSFIKDDIWCDDAFIIVKWHWRNTVGDCYMINIYGPQDSLAKAILWNRIGDFMHQHAEVDEALPDVRVTAIDRLWSDHNPILLHVSKSNFGPTPSSFSIPDTFESFDLFQKARLKWDIKGDENFKNFHGPIEQKRRAQMIHSIMKEGICISNPYQIKEEFLNFFKEKFKDHDSNVDFPPFANSSGLCALDRDSLETPVSLDEVKNAVWDCGSSKAPGFDGFFFAFVKKYWVYIKVDILEYVNIFLDTGSFTHGSDSSFFTLIPKARRSSLAFSFILVMEGLHNALSIIVTSVLIRGVKFGSPEVTISHLFYGDDVIITTEWNANDLDNILRVLQNVNVSSMASNSGCALGSFHFTYLELPISSNMSLTSSWQGLLDMF